MDALGVGWEEICAEPFAKVPAEVPLAPCDVWTQGLPTQSLHSTAKRVDYQLEPLVVEWAALSVSLAT